MTNRRSPRSAPPLLALLVPALLGCGGDGAGVGRHLALVGVTVIDGRGNAPQPERAVVIRDGRIAAVDPAAGFTAPRGATVVKLPGRFVMPGLVDVDAEVTLRPEGDDRAESERLLKTLLAFGVTTVRDPGAAGADTALRDAVAAGEIPGPRIVTASDPLSLPRALVGPAASRRDLLDRLATADPEGPEIGDRVAALAAGGAAVAPALIALHAELFADHPLHRQNPELALASPTLQALWQHATSAEDGTAEDLESARAAWPRVLALTRRLHDGGVPLAAGDRLPAPWVIPGVGLHQELRLLHDAGIPPLEVLRIATWNGAAALGLEGEIGSLEVGKVADLLVLGADPTVSPGNVRAISHVFCRGRFFDPSALLEFWQ